MKHILPILFLSYILASCHGQTMKDIFEQENIPLEVSGRVSEIILYKGGNITLLLWSEHQGTEYIAVSPETQNLVRKGDYFIKERNSNKCIVMRNDSIIYLDCYNIPKDIRDSIGKIEEWPKDKKGVWLKRRK